MINTGTFDASEPIELAGAQYQRGLDFCTSTTGKPQDNLIQAIECFQAALQSYSLEQRADEWATVRLHLGHSYRNLFYLSGKQVHLKAAIQNYEAILQVYSCEERSDEWAMVHSQLGMLEIARSGRPGPRMEKARQHFQAALQVYTLDHSAEEWAKTRHLLGLTYRGLALAGKSSARNLDLATSCFREALAVFQKMGMLAYVQLVGRNLEETGQISQSLDMDQQTPLFLN